MKVIETLYSWYGKHIVWAVGAVIITLLGGAFYVTLDNNVIEEEQDLPPTVVVGKAGEQNGATTIRLIGTVKAVDQVEIETEAAGRITAVRARLGERVSAGEVIATQENVSEQAAVLQAEGAYEAAVAASAQSSVGVAEAINNVEAAKNGAVNTYRTAFTLADGIIRGLIDEMFTDPLTGLTPGLRINGGDSTGYLNAERVAFRGILDAWQLEAATVTTDDDLVAALNEAAAHLSRLNQLIDTLTRRLSLERHERNSIFTATQIEGLLSRFNTARSNTNATFDSINNTKTGLRNATEALTRAQIGGSGPAVSAADAQVKQALGALQAAQANLEKTILRTPLAGVVNSISVDTGDFVGAFSPVAVIANNDALEITTYVGASDRDEIEIGDTVRIESDLVGTITNISGAVDPVTRKTEVKVATESSVLTAGESVTITLSENSVGQHTDKLFVPLTAVKFTESDGYVFTVEEMTLTSVPVTLGEIRGSYVEITDGITPDTVIVLDARGRAAGQKVEPVSN